MSEYTAQDYINFIKQERFDKISNHGLELIAKEWDIDIDTVFAEAIKKREAECNNCSGERIDFQYKQGLLMGACVGVVSTIIAIGLFYNFILN